MLAVDDRVRRQLRDLMARGLANGATLCLAESVAAGAALGPVVDELVERLYRCQPTTASRMARLGAGSPARGRLARSRWYRGRIGRGRQRGVARVSLEALFKIGNADLKPPVRLAQFGDLSPEQSVLRRELQEHSDDRLRPLLIDRLSLGAFHAQGVRGAEGRACLCPPRPSPHRWPWVDQLNAYTNVTLCRQFLAIWGPHTRMSAHIRIW